ncbi:Fur-regulated protein [Citrobacter sp. Cb080]|uniref:Fur-regulated protein n=1 Tax=Citrobacter sp. Cb080 TaxID=2985031 RepID=UPI0025785078|nr:Fur-regulated protein [Citrobacter sp. Cb080]MDM3325310.1 Fur-regulated protein [Citrobacter sp. Cb080]
MAEKIITLSGAANEVLYALFFRGALLSGDLPSKSGTAELRELGFAETRHTATEYQKENHFTFLTSEGQKFAVEHLVNTRFGEQQYCASVTLGIDIDTSAAQKAIDELDQRIRDTVSFELIRNGVPFIRDATITSDAIHAAAIETSHPVINIYNIGFGVRSDDANLETALENAAESAALDAAKQVAADKKAMDKRLMAASVDRRELKILLDEWIKESIQLNCKPGGLIWSITRK